MPSTRLVLPLLAAGLGASLIVTGTSLSSASTDAGRMVAPAASSPTDSGTWQALGQGLSGNVRSLAMNSLGNLAVGGAFTSILPGTGASRIALWGADDTWYPMGSGVSGGNVYALTANSTERFFVGGDFTQAGVAPANRFAQTWLGASYADVNWSALGSGIPSREVYSAAALADDSILFGGNFTGAGGVSGADDITVWNGTGFTATLGGTNGTVYAVSQAANGDIYAGGDFSTIGGVAVRNVARWRGGAWTTLSGGVNNEVKSVATSRSAGDESVFVGGSFTGAGGATGSDVTVNGVAMWRDDTWAPLGHGLKRVSGAREVEGLYYDSAHRLLYATGRFDFACGSDACLLTDDTLPLSNVGVWDVTAQRWRALATPSGQGVNAPFGRAVVASSSGRQVYVGGDFGSAGGVAGTSRIARWVWATPTLASITPATGPSAGGTPATLQGTSFIGVESVRVAGVATPFTWVDDSTITLSLPPGSGTVPVEVDAVGGRTSAVPFTYISPPPPTPASPPTSASAVAGDASADVTWAPPASSGSFPVSNYLVTAAPGGRTCLTALLTCRVAGLANGTTYTFTVAALTGAGWSPPSVPSNAITPVATPKPTITITGSRDGKRIDVKGTTTGFGLGGTLRPWLRLPGQSEFAEGFATILVSTDGTFEWSRRTVKRVSVYVATPDGSVRSNTVTVSAR